MLGQDLVGLLWLKQNLAEGFINTCIFSPYDGSKVDGVVGG